MLGQLPLSSTVLNVEVWGMILVIIGLCVAAVWAFFAWIINRFDSHADKVSDMIRESTTLIIRPIDDIDKRVERIGDSVQSLKDFTLPTIKVLEIKATEHEARIKILEEKPRQP